MFDIVIERAGSELGPIHFWCGYSGRDYAHAAMGSVGAIVRDERRYSPEKIEYQHEGVFAEDGSIPLVLNGKPYATIRIVETDIKRWDTPIWGARTRRSIHQIESYVGDDGAVAKCGRVLSLATLEFTGYTDPLPKDGHVCNDCLERGGLVQHAQAMKERVGA